MKMVIAFVQPFMVPRVVEALHAVPNLSGATFTEVRGFGRGRAKGVEASDESLLGTVPKMRVEAMISDSLENAVVQAIVHSAHTGNRGDGKIYVTRVQRAVRISTSEEGETAV